MKLQSRFVSDLSDQQSELITGAFWQRSNILNSANAFSSALAAPGGLAISAGTFANAVSIAQNIGISPVTSPSIKVPINLSISL